MNNFFNSLDNIALRGIASIAGVSHKELKDLQKYDPDTRDRLAREILGLSEDELDMVQDIRKKTPINWSLQKLHIPEEEYLRLLQDKRTKVAVQRLKDDEFPDVLNKEAAKLIQKRRVQIETLPRFLYFITERYVDVKSDSSWKKAPALNHVKHAKRLLDQMITCDELSLGKVYRVIQLMYFAVYVAVMGHTVQTTPVEPEPPAASRPVEEEYYTIVDISRPQAQA
jgi:hypothetical protein